MRISVFFVALLLGSVLCTTATATGSDQDWSAWFSPNHPIPAGTEGSWTVNIQVGSSGLFPGSVIRIAWRHNSDWSRPQCTAPDQPDFARVYSPPGARLKINYVKHFKRHVWDTWDWGLEISVIRGRVLPGAVIRTVLGDSAASSLGTAAQLFEQHDFSLRIALDRSGDGHFTPLRSQPAVPIIAGQPDRLVVLGPGIVNPGEEFPVNVFAEDYVGNPAVAELGELHVIRQLHSHSVSFPPIRQQRVSPEVLALTFRAPEEEGPLALTITAVALGLSADLENTRVSRNPTRIFWGDIHIHTDLSDGVGSLDDNIHFARTIAALDICAITDHDFLLTDDEWKLTQDAAETASVENVFLVFAGYEFSAETSEGGDRNVLYRERGPIIRCAKSEGPTVPSAWELYEKLPESDVLIIPHVGGRRANWDYYDHRERLAEITSVHGVFDPFFQEAITRGYKVGAVGSGDGHIGHPGRTFPGLTWARKRNGLVGVLAPALTRQDIWSALFERRVYATTGARILLNLSISRQPIGSVIERQARVSISGWVQGTAVISDIVLWSDCQQIMVFHPDQQAVELEWQVDLPQSAHAIYLEVRQGDGEKAWSSPVWMESAPEQTGAMSER